MDSTISVVSMLRCIRNVVPALQQGSRYLGPIFWLAVALLQFGHMAFYAEAAQLLRATIQQLSDQGLVEEQGVPESLLEHRYGIREIADQLDQGLKISFESNFSFSIASILVFGGCHDPQCCTGRAWLFPRIVVSCHNTEKVQGIIARCQFRRVPSRGRLDGECG